MANLQVVKVEFDGNEIQFREDGWFNATEAAAKFGKAPNDWLRLPDAKAYTEALESRYGKISYVKTSRARSDRGGGTWMHPKLGVTFARWLDVNFSIWCDEQIDLILRGNVDHKRLRHVAASSFKVMQDILKVTRSEDGRDTKQYHYSNEARLINYALSGKFGAIDRDSLTSKELLVLARLEERNSVLIARGVEYASRKTILEQYALDMKDERLIA